MHTHYLLFFLFASLIQANKFIYKRDDYSTDPDGFYSTTADNDESTIPVNQDLFNSRGLFKGEPNVTTITNSVDIQLYCEIDNTHCKKVQQSFIAAATKFSEVVNIKNKIVFQASYYSFCLNRCSNSTFGWGAPSSLFTLILQASADSNFIYPQPLAKQWLQNNDNSSWAQYKYDVVIDINHDMYMNALNLTALKLNDKWNGKGVPEGGGYWFNVSNAPSIEDHQVDLEYIILHQMIHGLGMTSSWAPYFSDTNSPFQQLLKGLIPMDDLKIMTPSPYWFVKQHSGPAYITGFKPNMVFDKFLNLVTPTNETASLVEYGFDMQNFCQTNGDAFIANFMNLFLNNATQSSRAKSMYVSMATPKTLYFKFDSNYFLTSNQTTTTSQYFTNEYLNTTYHSIQLMTGPDILASGQETYYRPGLSTSHVDDRYMDTPDFLMTHLFIRGKTLQTLIEDGYSNIPPIKYNVTLHTNVNVTTIMHNNTNHQNITYNVTTLQPKQVMMENVYKSAIGPGILRILETIGYSTVLTNTNYTSPAAKTNKPDSPCDKKNGENFNTPSDDSSTPITKATSNTSKTIAEQYFILLLIILIIIM